MIEAEYTISYVDYKSALRLYYRKRPWSIINLFVVYGAVAFFVILVALGIWMRLRTGAGQSLAANGWLAYNAVFAIIIPLALMINRRRCYRALFPTGSQRNFVLTANEELLISAIPGTAEGRYLWNAFQDYAENKRAMILFVNKRRFLIVPHHALNDTQWAEFRSLVAEKTKQKEAVA